jgi:hypothetical protein
MLMRFYAAMLSYEMVYVMPLAVPEVIEIDVPSIRYMAVVLSTAITDALAGTEIVEITG